MSGVDVRARGLRKSGMISERASGVYAIANLVNGKCYIGSTSQSFAKRFRNHRHDLVRGRHHSEPLQRAWVKYGEAAFMFYPLEAVEPEGVVRVEQQYLEKHRPAYNVAPIAGSPLGVRHTERAKENMRQAFKKSNERPEVKANRSVAQLAVWACPEARARKAAGQNRSDVKERKSSSGVASWADPEVVARRIAGMLSAHATPEVKARKSAVMKDRWQDPDYRAKRAEETKARWQDPEYRARMVAVAKKMHADRASKSAS